MFIIEFVIIGGAALGAFVVSNPCSVVTGSFSRVFELLKPNPYGAQAYSELLKVLYDVFEKARKDGVGNLDDDVRVRRSFIRDHRAFLLVRNTLSALSNGEMDERHVAEQLDVIVDADHRRQFKAIRAVPRTLAALRAVLPAFGVAAVSVTILALGTAGGATNTAESRIAAAFTGAFLGLLVAYASANPITAALEERMRAERDYVRCVCTALVSFARGDSPATCVEFARREIEPLDRPAFAEIEVITKRAA